MSLNSEEEVCRVVEVQVNPGLKKRKFAEKEMVDQASDSAKSEKPMASKPKRSKFSFRPRNY